MVQLAVLVVVLETLARWLSRVVLEPLIRVSLAETL